MANGKRSQQLPADPCGISASFKLKERPPQAARSALCARLARPLTIHQGHGSVLLCRPLADGRIEVGGRVTLDEVREHRVGG